jgi:hypothetical protein
VPQPQPRPSWQCPPPPKPDRLIKVKQFFKQYFLLGNAIYLLFSFSSIAIFYFVFKAMNVGEKEVDKVIQWLNIDYLVTKEIRPMAAPLVLAFIVAKLIAPLKLASTMYITPRVSQLMLEWMTKLRR